ncbi:MAG: proline--tRNA ligase [Planctomycetia bacterium]|nr:proline--tRNA ligase [Planctomycetia bacterium]
MRWTKSLILTKKETPEGAEIPSHIFMIRSGLISQVMAGVYAYLPLGLRALRKAEGIVREEMNRAEAVELLMSAISPQSLWEETHRVEAFGNVLMKFVISRGNRTVPLVLCPTHEEPITDLISRAISSYRQMPITLYQIQTKFRNEERPRFGVMRTSEFLMKDAYSFDTCVEGLNESYRRMYEAYHRIFNRCCLNFLPVEAESGPIGGDASHEFMILSENGEDNIVVCPTCRYAANTEKAEVGSFEPTMPSTEEPAALEKVMTPGTSSIEAVCKFLQCPPEKMLKTLIFEADGKPIVVVVRGDHDANENKIRRFLDAEKVELASEEVIRRVTGAPVGFAGPVGLKEDVPVYADFQVQTVVNGITGANSAGEEAHLTGVQPGRDFEPVAYADLRNAVAGDPCPRCSGTLQMQKALEVGHVFKLGTKYTEALQARFLDDDETLQPIIMGCYGIGIARILAGLIENSYDEKGILWPVSLAPYEVCLVPMRVQDDATMAATEKLYEELTAAGVDVLIDDRDARAGVKFNDVDLIGFPLRVVIGPKGLANGEVEVKWRWDENVTMLPLEQAGKVIGEWITAERNTGERYCRVVKGEKEG